MLDLEKLQEMAKNGEISKKLLEDENFKMELKKILKEESGLEITDEQIPEILKNFENALQDEEVLKEAKLETVSGGVKEVTLEQYKKYGAKHKRIRNTIGIFGSILGVACTMPSVHTAGNEYGEMLKKSISEGNNGKAAKSGALLASQAVTSIAAGVGVASLSFRLGNLIAYKILERDLKKDECK